MPSFRHARGAASSLEADIMSTFALGQMLVRRSGYGAVQLSGPYAFGPSPDRGSAIGVLLAAVAAGVDHLLRAVVQTEIVCVQNLFNLADQRSLEVLEEGRWRGITFVPFCSLGWPRGVQNTFVTSPTLAGLGTRLEATPAQIALAWLLDLAPNILFIPGNPDPSASSREHPRGRRAARRRGPRRAGAIP